MGLVEVTPGPPTTSLLCSEAWAPGFPSPDASSLFSPGGPEFLRTPLGGSFLVHESFLYRREKAAGEKVYWTCRDQARMGCRSRAITQGQRVMVMRRHCHPPDLGGLEALRQREQFPSSAQREGSGVGRHWALVSLLAWQPLGPTQNTGWRTFHPWPMSSGVQPCTSVCLLGL